MKGKPAILGGEVVFMESVPIVKPAISKHTTADFMERVKQILDSGLVTNHTHVATFEEAIGSFLDVRGVAAVSSCTSGLILTLQSLGLSDSEVLIPTFTFAASVHAGYWNRCRIVFVDCDPHSFNISIEDLERKLSKHSAAVLATHIFGNPCQIDVLERISRERGLKLLFDSAHCLGGSFKGKKIGGFGDSEIFSCSPTKLLTTMEGGIITTNDVDLAQNLKTARNYGVYPDYTCDQPGLSARMAEINALLGLEMLSNLDEGVSNRNVYASQYQHFLSEVPGIRFQEITPDSVPTYKDFAIIVDPVKFGIDRDLLCRALGKENVATKKYFSPLAHELGPYRDLPHGVLANAEFLAAHVLCLPIYNYMEDDLIERVCFTIQRIHEHADEVGALGAGEFSRSGRS